MLANARVTTPNNTVELGVEVRLRPWALDKHGKVLPLAVRKKLVYEWDCVLVVGRTMTPVKLVPIGQDADTWVRIPRAARGVYSVMLRVVDRANKVSRVASLGITSPR